MSMLVISQDHFTTEVAYGPGSLTYTKDKVGTRHVYFIIRTLADPQNPDDLKAAKVADPDNPDPHVAEAMALARRMRDANVQLAPRSAEGPRRGGGAVGAVLGGKSASRSPSTTLMPYTVYTP
jgi:hypothetical protein